MKIDIVLGIIIIFIFFITGCNTSVSQNRLEPYRQQVRQYRLRTTQSTGLNDLLAMSDDQFDLAHTVLTLCAENNNQIDIKQNLDLIDELAAELALRLDGKTKPKDKVNTLCDFVWAKGFHAPQPFWKDYSAREYFDLWQLNYTDFSRLLNTRQGNCLSLSILYLSLAERVGLPLYGVAIPHHIFVRYDDGVERFNLETTHNGHIYSDKDYIDQYSANPHYTASFYLNNLTKKQVLGCLLLNLGTLYYRHKDIKTALKFHRMALKTNFNDPSLLYSIGNEYLLLSDLKRAQTFYKESLLQYPHNPFIYSQLGYIFWIKKDYPQSLNYLKHAQDILTSQETERKRMPGESEKTSFAQTCLAMTRNYMANVYLDMGNAQLALEEAQQALDIWRFKSHVIQYYNYNSVVDIYRTLGRIYLALDEPDNSIRYYKMALARLKPSEGNNRKKLEGIILAELGNTHRKNGSDGKAEKYFDEAGSIFKSLGDANWYLKVMRMKILPE